MTRFSLIKAKEWCFLIELINKSPQQQLNHNAILKGIGTLEQSALLGGLNYFKLDSVYYSMITTYESNTSLVMYSFGMRGSW